MTNDFNKTENDSTKTRNERFTIQGVGISDHERKRLYDLQTIDGFISVRDELNALHEENIQLKHCLKKIEKELREYNELIWNNEVKEMYPLKEEGKQYRS